MKINVALIATAWYGLLTVNIKLENRTMKTPSEAKHTPGPWIIQRDNENPLLYIVTDSRTESNVIAGPFLSENTMHPDDRLARQAADAHLIASAPELLRQRDELKEALKNAEVELLKITQSYVCAKRELNQMHGFNEDVTIFPVVVSAKEAISNARASLASVEKEGE